MGNADWTRRFRRERSVESILLIASVYVSVVFNSLFWSQVSKFGALHGGTGILTAVCLFVAITAIHFFLFAILCNRWTIKVVLPLLLMISAAAAYYMAQYTVYLDSDMIRNVLHTDTKESAELLKLPMIARVVGLGLLPSLLLWWTPIRRAPIGRALLRRVLWMVVAAVLALGSIFASYQPLSSLMRNHKEVRYLLTPGNILLGLLNVATKDTTTRPVEIIGADAKSIRNPGGKPRLLVLVVGETVRAQNWGLNGYARNTTPQLKTINPISFSNVSSCGTATETSLPCMFTPWGRSALDLKRIRNSQSFLHVLDRAGIGTYWIDNQSGCKGVCRDLPFESIQHVSQPSPHCTVESGCYDQALLDRLQTYLQKAPVNKDLIVVMHQLGNHGPSYHARYPAQYKVFTPECLTDELNQCSQQQITNSYDNAIVATDAFLASTIRYLGGLSDRDTALVYLSDHGESLGENGLYLHGLPYAIAPATQTSVPMFLWFSPQFAADRQVNEACLRQKVAQPASHDNLFHTVLGIMQVRTREYVAGRDLLQGCGP